MKNHQKRAASGSLKAIQATKKPSTAYVKHRQQKRAVKSYLKQKRSWLPGILLQPITLVVLLATGVLMVGWTYHAMAETLTVTATVPAPALTEPATITFPADGSIFT